MEMEDEKNITSEMGKLFDLIFCFLYVINPLTSFPPKAYIFKHWSFIPVYTVDY